MKQIKYLPEYYGEGIEGAYTIDIHHHLQTDEDGEYRQGDLAMLAEEIGHDYHYNHDGWEDNDWPILFIVWIDEDETPYEIEVNREAVPNFYQSTKAKRTEVEYLKQ